MKKGLDPNKIFAGVLMAALVAAFAGFLSRELMEVEYPEKKGFAPVVTESSEPGAVAEAPKEIEPVDTLLASAKPEDG